MANDFGPLEHGEEGGRAWSKIAGKSNPLEEDYKEVNSSFLSELCCSAETIGLAYMKSNDLLDGLRCSTCSSR